MMEKRGVIDPGETSPDDPSLSDQHKQADSAGDNLESHPTQRLADEFSTAAKDSAG